MPARPEPPPLPPHAAPSLPPGCFRPRRTADAAEAAGPDAAADVVLAGAAGLLANAAARLGAAGRGARCCRPLVAGAGLAVLAIGALSIGLWLRGRPAPSPAPGSSAAVGELTQELVRKQVQLAHRELDDKNYAAAAAEAEGALKLAPGNAEAAAVLARTRERVGELDRSIAEARRLLDAGDTAGASGELSHLLELDPRHPAAAELSARLNSAFRAQADAAVSSMREARAAALAAGVTAWSLRSVDAGVSQAELLLSKSEFADATRMFLEARDAFDRSRRAALERDPATPAPGGTPVVAQAAPANAAPPPATRPALDARIRRLASRRPSGLPRTARARASRLQSPTPRPWRHRRPAASRASTART